MGIFDQAASFERGFCNIFKCTRVLFFFVAMPSQSPSLLFDSVQACLHGRECVHFGQKANMWFYTYSSMLCPQWVKIDGARCPFSTFLRLQGDHHCACAQKWCHFSFFPRAFKQKKIKALRPKMTKIASRGSCLNKIFVSSVLLRREPRRALF